MYIGEVLPQQVFAPLEFFCFYITLYPSSLFAGRPLVIDDATPVAKGHVELEVGLSHSQPHDGGREQKWPVLGLTWIFALNF